MREGQDFGQYRSFTRDIRQGSRVWGLPEPPAYRGFHLRVTRDTPPISLLDSSCPHRVLSGGFPDADGDAVLVFPIVEHGLYPQLRTEGFKVLL